MSVADAALHKHIANTPTVPPNIVPKINPNILITPYIASFEDGKSL